MQTCDCCHAPPAVIRRDRKPQVAQTEKPVENAPAQETVELSDHDGHSCSHSAASLARTSEESAYQALLGGFTNFSAASIPDIFKLAEEHDPSKITHVLYHGGCRDGMTAAWAAYKALGDKAEYIPVGYQAPPPELPADARVAVVDFSFLKDVHEELRGKVEDIVVLDHHDTAAERLQGVDGVLVDQERAGAGLAWHFFHPDKPLPALVAYAEDRDLWRFDLPLSAEVGQAMGSHPMNLETWDSLDIDNLKQEGIEITAHMNAQNEELLDLIQWGDIAGHRVPIINSNVNVDELCTAIFERHPEAEFVATYYDQYDARKWSLRARNEFEVNQVAAQFGGGGHQAAAGFKQSGKNKAMRVNPPANRHETGDDLMPRMRPETPAVERFVEAQVARSLSKAFMAKVDGHEVPVVNTPVNRLEVGEGLMEKYPDAPFVGVFYSTASGDRHWSLYSRQNSDVADIADKFGGSGTARRAQFTEGRPRRLQAQPK